MVAHLRLALPVNLASSPDKLTALEGAFEEMTLLEEVEVYHAHRWPRGSPIILPSSTRTLLFTVASWHLAGRFLQTLSIIPAEEMTIRCDGPRRNEDVGPFDAHFPRLTTLRLMTDFGLPRVVMSTIATSISAIHHLSIGPLQDMRHALAILAETHAQAGDQSNSLLLWPEMRVLSIDTGLGVDILADLHNLLLKRAAHNSPMHTIHLSPVSITQIRESCEHDFEGLGVQLAELERVERLEWW